MEREQNLNQIHFSFDGRLTEGTEYFTEETLADHRYVSLEDILRNFHESWFSMDPHTFPLNNLAARASAPIFEYFHYYFPNESTTQGVTGSPVRHAAMITRSPDFGSSEQIVRSHRYSLDRVVRNSQAIMEQLEVLPTNISEKIRQIVYSSPDFDFLLPQITKTKIFSKFFKRDNVPHFTRKDQNLFFKNIHTVLLPYLGYALTMDDYYEHPETVRKNIQARARISRDNLSRIHVPQTQPEHIHTLSKTARKSLATFGDVTYAAILPDLPQLVLQQ